MIEFERVLDLAEIVRGTSTSGRVLVGFDGVDGAGKTFVSCEVSKLLGWRLIHLDDYLVRDQGTYSDNLKYGELRQAMELDEAPLLLEGVCLLDVVAKLGVSLTKHVYVKRVNAHGFWNDECECDFAMTAEEKIVELEAQTKLIARFIDQSTQPDGKGDVGALTEFRKEVIRYHATRSPARVADHVFCRKEIDA